MDTTKVRIKKWSQYLEEGIGGVKYISAVVESHLEEEDKEEYRVFDIKKKIDSMKGMKEMSVLVIPY